MKSRVRTVRWLTLVHLNEMYTLHCLLELCMLTFLFNVGESDLFLEKIVNPPCQLSYSTRKNHAFGSRNQLRR